MSKKEDYKRMNKAYLENLASALDIHKLSKGVLYKIIKSGEVEAISPHVNSVVTVYYKGYLINNKVFDDNTGQPYPDAFRLNTLIAGWQIALPQMRVGDKWQIYIPSEMGYGTQSVSGIPKNSTLIFEIELVSVS